MSQGRVARIADGVTEIQSIGYSIRFPVSGARPVLVCAPHRLVLIEVQHSINFLSGATVNWLLMAGTDPEAGGILLGSYTATTTPQTEAIFTSIAPDDYVWVLVTGVSGGQAPALNVSVRAL